MAARTFLLFISLLYLVNFTNAFDLQDVIDRLNILETKFEVFDMEHKRMRSDIKKLFVRDSHMSTGGKRITASEHMSREASSGNGEHVSPKEIAAPLDRTTILPYTDKNKTTESALELQKLKSYLIEGAKVEKDTNLKLRTELKGISNMLKTDFTMLESIIKEEIRNFTNHLSENQKSLEIDYANFTSNIEAKINNLTNHLSEKEQSMETEYTSFKSYIREDMNNLKDDISEHQKSLVNVERFDNFKDFMTTKLSAASNESRQAIISLESEFEMSISKISNNVSTVSKTLANINNLQTEIGRSMQEFSNLMNKTLSNIKDVRSEFQSSNQEFVQNLCTMNEFYANTEKKRSCRHFPYSGEYILYLCGKSVSSVRVYCDQTTDGGGWIVFQRRQDGSVDFERTWADYKTGFGNLTGEFWLGNDNLHALTSAGFNELRIDLEDFGGNRRYAKYSYFTVKSESENYKLEVRGYSGDAGDSLTGWHNGMSFSTKDRDNDRWSVVNCSVDRRGAWWYHSCHYSNLNGFYYGGANSPYSKGVIWYTWRGDGYSLKRVEMKIR